MSPSAGDVAHTPEPKSSGAFAIFKNLTSGKSSKTSNAQLPVSQAQQLHGVDSLQSTIYGGPPNYEQLFEQLKAGNDLPDRILAAESLRLAVQDYPLSGVTSIFKQGKDLIDASNSREARRAGFDLLTACVKQATSTDPERLAYFRILTAPANPEDFHLQLASVVELAKNGRDLSGFHYETLPLLTAWLRTHFNVTTTARKQAGRQNRAQKGKAVIAEETNLSLLFALIVDVIKFSFNVSSEETTGELIEAILHICTHTTLSGDLKACINVIDAIVTYGDIPSSKLVKCVKVLCSIHCVVNDVQTEAWRSISYLARSHNGQTTVRILLNILENPPNPLTNSGDGKQAIREIRGAISVLDKLFAEDGENGYPLVPFTLLTSALSKVVVLENAKVENDILRLVLSLFNTDADTQEVKSNILEEEWSPLFEVVKVCAARTIEMSDSGSSSGRSYTRSQLSKEEGSENSIAASSAQTLSSLILRLEEILTNFSNSNFFQRDECVHFFISLCHHLPESCAKLVIDHYIEYRYCYPSDISWKDNSKMILQAFFADRAQPTHIRLHALGTITNIFQVVEMMEENDDPESVHAFVTSILEDMGEERDIAILQEVVSFAVSVAEATDMNLFKYIIDSFRGSIKSDRLQSPLGSPPASRHGLTNNTSPTSASSSTAIQSPSNVVTRGLVQIFMRTMDKSDAKAIRVFAELLWIAKSRDCETDARLSALKMLVRLRADWANRIFLTPFTESEGLAASLYRTKASLERRQNADEAFQQHRTSRTDDSTSSRMNRSTSFTQGQPLPRQPQRSASTILRTVQRNHQMWMSPDNDALPDHTSEKASSILVSIEDVDFPHLSTHHGEPNVRQLESTSAKDGVSKVTMVQGSKTILNISQYLEIIIGLLRDGCEWEVFSYVLVHVASQLTNQALFRSAIPQIKLLREILCDQIKNNSFQDPPVSSGLRKADVGICHFQLLNMVMSYHQHFSRQDQDEIVRTFLHGVGERTSKCCIHALSICCHELPLSISKALVSILQKMSQIITQSHVAIHILEFLACLARLPNLYWNFREDEYRIVFAICFRYLQYVRDQRTKDSSRNSIPSSGRNSAITAEILRGLADNITADSNLPSNTSDDLPQYVYALAYHVIIFWFLSLKLADRAGQVGWIAKNLISTDASGKEQIDEQAQVTLDFMQRVAYADVDESDPDPSFNESTFGPIQKKRWIIGNSIITVEQATRGDWAQITKRQPSGTSSYIIQERFLRPPPHQTQGIADALKDGRAPDENVKLPSHLLLQLTASIPQAAESLRPIPLPEDEFMERAIKSFNRSFTVDGHKVGVIYIGENQRNEIEILSNIQGSRDYTEFLSGLGTLTRLKGADFNTQGLDRQMDTDGEYTFCWRDRVTEIVFHVTTQMPTNLDRDPQCIGKKRHIGNDFVNIIFNNSGRPFEFDTFPSEFNYVNIVITPESRASFVAKRCRSKADVDSEFYKIQVMSKPGFPEISAAAETKIVSLAALPGLIRLLALNASVFSLVWSNREGGEHISSWRSRLREINRLRDRYTPAKPSTSNAISPPGTASSVNSESKPTRDSMNGLRRGSVANFLSNNEPASQRSSILSTAETEIGPGGNEEPSLIDSLDFSRWA